MSRLGKPWTAHDMNRMKSMAAGGYSAKQTATSLRRSRGSVAFKAMVSGVSFRAINQQLGVQRARFAKRRARK